VRTSRWFTAENIAPVRFTSDQEYVEAARAQLDRSVGARLPKQGPFATGLSGGFDSGGVTATAARLLGDQRLMAFTRVSTDAQADDGGERHLAGLLAARYPNLDWIVVDEVREAYRDTMPESEAGATLLPRTSSFNATWFETLAIRVERSGVEVILNGGCGNSTLSYAGQPQIGDDLRGGRIGGAVRALRGLSRQRGTSLARTAASQLYRALAPRSLERWRAQRRDGAMPWLRYSLVSPDFLSELDYAEHARARGHDVPFDLPVSAREMRLRMIQGQTGRDFRGHGKRKRKFVSRDPYCDRRMVEFCLGIPEDQYWRDGQSRWLARRALADRVPAETLNHVAVGVQSADWYVTASARREAMAEAVDRIARSPMASRVLDVPRMRKLLDTWPSDAEEATRSFMLHGHALQRAIAMGGFLRWHEGRND
jgi:asparagine synthase (glutamine-hydrolysing)